MNFINKLLIFEEAWSEDKKRKSYLLNFISFLLICFLLIIITIRFFGEIFFGFNIEKESFLFLFLILIILSLMIFLVKKGFIRLISILIISLLLFSTLKGSFSWGIDLYTVDIMYPFIILLSAVLVGPKFSFLILVFISFSLSMIYFLQNSNYIPRHSEWRASFPSYLNLITIITIYSLMAFLSWLSSREIEKSLRKTKKLANQLKIQNENLELIVESRTKELKKFQLKQLTKLAPLVDLGKLSAGLIHDIRNPLSVLSILLQEAKDNHNQITDLAPAFLAINQIDDLSRMGACKVFNKEEAEIFDLNTEIEKLIALFEHKCQSKKIKIIFKPNKRFELHADRSKLMQILANLILNAIEAYENSSNNDRHIFIKLLRKPRNLLIQVKDYGCGIAQDNLLRIFEPYFSLKSNKESIGFGLYISQEIMNRIFQSQIKVESKLGVGSTFTVFIKNRFILNELKKLN